MTHITSRTRGTGPRFLWQVIPAVLYVVGVFYAGTRPDGPEIPWDFGQRDKVLHAAAFGGMSVLLWRAMQFRWPEARFGRKLILAGGISALLGALLEVWQSFVPGRSMDFFDWVADVIGIALAAGAVFLLRGWLTARDSDGDSRLSSGASGGKTPGGAAMAVASDGVSACAIGSGTSAPGCPGEASEL
jgi:hypothetical protein